MKSIEQLIEEEERRQAYWKDYYIRNKAEYQDRYNKQKKQLNKTDCRERWLLIEKKREYQRKYYLKKKRKNHNEIYSIISDALHKCNVDRNIVLEI